MQPSIFKTLFLLVTFAGTSYGQTPVDPQFDPATFIQSRENHPEIHEGLVKIKGLEYRVFKSEFGTLYVPTLENFDRQNFDGSLCANEVSAQQLEKCSPDDIGCFRRNRDRITSEVTVIRADTPLTEHTKAYAEIIGMTIQRKCSEVGPAYFTPVLLRPEAGIEYKDTEQRDPTAYKVYMQGPKPGLGFKSEW